MIGIFRKYKQQKQLIKDQEARIEQQLQEIKTLTQKIAQMPILSVKSIVNRITDDKFKWFDYLELSREDQKVYYEAAVSALRNQTIQNEAAKLRSEFALWAAKHSRDYDGVTAMRYQISGIELLLERLGDIRDPYTKKPEIHDPHAPI